MPVYLCGVHCAVCGRQLGLRCCVGLFASRSLAPPACRRFEHQGLSANPNLRVSVSVDACLAQCNVISSLICQVLAAEWAAVSRDTSILLFAAAPDSLERTPFSKT